MQRKESKMRLSAEFFVLKLVQVLDPYRFIRKVKLDSL